MHGNTCILLHRHHFFLFKPNRLASDKTKEINMAHLRDEYGQPVELTDELGNPVELTDERGSPVHVTGIATKEPPDVIETTVTESGVAFVPDTGLLSSTNAGTTIGGDVVHESTGLLSTMNAAGTTTTTLGDVLKGETLPSEHPTATGGGVFRGEHKKQDVGTGQIQRSTSSSSSEEDDGQGGRRKKKGLKQKLKEKLHLGGKHKEEHAVTSTTTTATTTTPSGEHLHHEHEKKSVMEKIKEKLPGHHNQAH